ncbi:flagellar hook-length control protein FliK [Paraglaciecola sp.]|uniref:flagellar hook-length control protein FliK n=1 Tax=Paraglaciecola sp. TaxID=1920173 RepID=UPI003EF9C76E
MPDIPQTPNTVLPQTQSQSTQINQLSQLAASSEIANQTIEVMVKHLSGNLLNLTRTKGLLNKPAILPQANIQGKLNNNQTHTLKASIVSSPQLEFYSANSVNQQKLINLSNQQIQSLLQLPPKQIFASLVNALGANLQKTLSTNATVLSSSINTSQANTIQLQQTLQPNTKINITAPDRSHTDLPKVAKESSILKLQVASNTQPITLNIPKRSHPVFSPGEKLVLTLKPAGASWQVNAQPTSTSTSTSNFTAPTALSDKNQRQSFLVPQKDSVELIKAFAVRDTKSLVTQLELPLKQTIQLLTKNKSADIQSLVKALQNQSIDKLSIELSSTNKQQLRIESNQPIATIPINKEIAQALAPLKLPNQKEIIKLVNQQRYAEQATTRSNNPSLDGTVNPKITPDTSDKVTPQQILVNAIKQLGDNAKRVLSAKADTPPIKPHNDVNVPANKAIPNQSTAENQIVKTDNNAALANAVKAAPNVTQAELKPDLKQLAESLLQRVQLEPRTNSVITPKFLTDKNQQHQLIQQLSRIVQAKAETPSNTLINIEKTLTDGEFFKTSSDLSNKQFVEQVLQQTKSALPQSKETDPQNIRQLLSSPALNLSANQLTSPANQSGLVSGLVALLQVSLGARLAKNQNTRSELVARTLNSILPSMTKAPNKMTAKSLNEFSQLEQKHQLMREIGRLLSGHQANKLSNAEQMLQGQESLYYNLPTVMGGIFKDVELLIKREEKQSEQKDAEQNANQTWQLTMKLSVGELGELLTKAKLRPDNLELNFYASNEEVKLQVMNYLPLFKRKLKSLGIEVNKSQCQLGKIPVSLQQRPYHVFQTKV